MQGYDDSHYIERQKITFLLQEIERELLSFEEGSFPQDIQKWREELEKLKSEDHYNALFYDQLITSIQAFEESQNISHLLELREKLDTFQALFNR